MTQPTIEEIRKARDKCAFIVTKYGQQYLPIFERLEKELQIRESRQSSLEKAHMIAMQFDTRNVTQNATQKLI